MHVHSKYATVLASLKDSRILPIDQNTMRFFGRVAIDDGYDGMGLGDEAERMVAGLGDKSVMIRSEEHTSELQSLMRLSYAVFCLTKNINTTRTDDVSSQMTRITLR